MSDRRPSSTKLRRQCFDNHKYTDALGRIRMDCHLCNLPIDPVRDEWEAEHVLRRALGGELVPDIDGEGNVQPAHVDCHNRKTKVDVRENAKGKRMSDRHFGIKRSRGFGNSRFRKKVSGEVVRRDE